MGEDTVFLVRNVTKRYGSREVLSGISFEVRKGEILGIIGASGAGKTTLLHMLVGFVPGSTGDILFHAYTPGGIIECNVLDHHRLVNRSYGFASQQPSFYEKLTVLENLRYFGAMYNMGGESVAKNAEVLLRLMDLKSSAHLLAEHLSGGMKRRLDIACALIHNPPVLILDEPTADLDPMLRSHIWEVLKRINGRGTTIILSSHHLNELDALCHRIGIIKDGKLVDIDTPEKLKSKYSRTQEIIIESFPGNYDEVIKRLKADRADRITAIRREGTYLTIRTEAPETVIAAVLQVLHKLGESLLDLKLIKPNLDNVFVTIYRKAELKEGLSGLDDLDFAKQQSAASVSDNALKTMVEQLKSDPLDKRIDPLAKPIDSLAKPIDSLAKRIDPLDKDRSLVLKPASGRPALGKDSGNESGKTALAKPAIVKPDPAGPEQGRERQGRNTRGDPPGQQPNHQQRKGERGERR